jgi:hypothetical protein
MSRKGKPTPWEARIPGTPLPGRFLARVERWLKWQTQAKQFSAMDVATLTRTLAVEASSVGYSPTVCTWVQACDTSTPAVAMEDPVYWGKIPHFDRPETPPLDIMNREGYMKQREAERVAKGFVHPNQRTLRDWSRPDGAENVLPAIEMPIKGVAWHSPKTQEPGGSHMTPGLTMRATRVRDRLFLAFADGVDSPVAFQFSVEMPVLLELFARFSALPDKPGGYMMYLTGTGEVRYGYNTKYSRTHETTEES